jgi:hypothetical protein
VKTLMTGRMKVSLAKSTNKGVSKKKESL